MHTTANHDVQSTCAPEQHLKVSSNCSAVVKMTH